MFTVVVPQFAQLYDQMGSKLPAMTLVLLASASGCSTTSSTLCSSPPAAAYARYRFSLTERGQDFADGVRVRLPDPR